MQRVITMLIVVALGWYGYTKYQERLKTENSIETLATSAIMQADFMLDCQ